MKKKNKQLILALTLSTLLFIGCTANPKASSAHAADAKFVALTENTTPSLSQSDPQSEFIDKAEISKQQAMEIAVSQISGATTDNIREFEADRDHGHLTYEGSLRYNGVEYEFEIDGTTGMILNWEIDD